MPILLEPDCTFCVSLEIDKSKPVDIRPAFIARSQSMRGQRSVLEVIDCLHEDGATIDSIFERTLQKLKQVVIGWKNIDKPFTPDVLDEVLTFGEARELLSKVAYNQRMDTEEKKD